MQTRHLPSSLPSSDGIDSLKLFDEMFTSFKCCKEPMVEGMLLSSLLPARDRYASCVSLEISSGIFPVRPFFD